MDSKALDTPPQAELAPPTDTFPRRLPAIVGVGATLTFWVSLVRFLITVITAVISHVVPNYEFDGLYRLLKSLDCWIVPWPFILGVFLLSLVQEDSGAKSSFKLSWVLMLTFWTWTVVVMFEKNPESIPKSVLWIANLVGLAYTIALFWGCLRLSKFCQDGQMMRWSRIAVALGVSSYLITVFRDGCDLIGPNFFHHLSEKQFHLLVQVYEGLYYVHWAVWIPLVYCNSRTLWRIIAHAEIEAQKNIPLPSPSASTGARDNTEDR